jgi:hypothetical protein
MVGEISPVTHPREGLALPIFSVIVCNMQKALTVGSTVELTVAGW